MSGWQQQARIRRAAHGATMLAVTTLAAAALTVSAAWAYTGGPNPAASTTQGYLGVGLRDVTDNQLSALKLKEARGAEILSVDHDGPAGKMGLRVHDVILQMNGEVVQGQEQLRRMLHETPAGRSVTLMISRDGQQQTLQTQLANREEVERKAWEDHLTVPDPQTGELSVGPSPGVRLGGAPPPSGGMGFLHGGGLTGRTRSLLSLGGPYTGALVEPVGPQLAQFFGVSDGAGLLVKSVDTNSPAAVAGLRAGDVVVKANQTALSSPGDWSRIMHQSKGQPVSLTVMRDRKEQTLTLTPDAKRRSAADWPFTPGFADMPPVDAGALVAELRPREMPDLSRRLPSQAELQKMLDAAKRNLPDQAKLQAMLDDAQRDAPNQAELQKMLDDAKRNLPDQAKLQAILNDAQRNAPNQAELQKMLDDAKRNLPDPAKLQAMLDDAQRNAPSQAGIERALDAARQQFNQQKLDDFQLHLPDSNELQKQMDKLREQMMLSVPGSMD